MLRRPIQRVEPQRLVAGVPDVVARAGRNDDGEVALDVRLEAVDPDFPLALLDPEELVTVRMDLLADFLARLDGHQHELELLAGVQHASEIRVVLGHVLDVVDEPSHGSVLSSQIAD
jgi:hypothetical protein